MKHFSGVSLLVVLLVVLGTVPTYAASPLSPEAKVLACQDREGGIKERSERLVQNVETILHTFEGIALRTQNHYENTTLPSGKVVSNFNELIAEISAKQQAVTPLVAKAREDINSFGCTTQDPKAQLEQFNNDMTAIKQGLQEYRNAIRNLILSINAA
jgi:hypothetical protein